MAHMRRHHILVVDVEATCWSGTPPTTEQAEIIEVGIAEVRVDADVQIARTAAYLIKPRVSAISPFCSDLTGITPARMQAQGRPFGEVCNRIRKEFGNASKTWAAWGRDDHDIAKACAAHGISNPFSDSFIDLAQLWGFVTGASRGVPLECALSTFGLTVEGTQHRAMDDAKNAARVLIEILRLIRAGLYAATES